LVAAGEACVRLRSSREIRRCGVSGRPRAQVLRLLLSRTQALPAATDRVRLSLTGKGRIFLPEKNRSRKSNKPVDTGVLWFVFTFFHNLALNLSLTHLFQTLDRISRYFKANFSAFIR
jgi:hypothetical protein